MAVTAKVPGPLLESLFAGQVNFTGSTVKAMLAGAAYTPNYDTHRYKSSVTNEITGTGYTAGGVTVTSKTVSYDALSRTLTVDSADPSWASATFTARYLIYYVDTGVAGTSPIVSIVDFGQDISVTAATFTYQNPTTGIVQGTRPA